MKRSRTDGKGRGCVSAQPLLAAAVLLYLDLRIGSNAVNKPGGAAFGAVLLAASGCFGLAWLALHGWGAALLARFEYAGAKGLAPDARRLAAGKPLPSLLMVLPVLWMPLCQVFAAEVFVYPGAALSIIGSRRHRGCSCFFWNARASQS